MSDKNGSSSADKPDVDELRAEIAQTRAELGDTVQALAAKADVKARAKDQVEQTKQKVMAQTAEATEKVRDAAVVATDKVRSAAAQAGDVAQEAEAQVRRNPVPFAAVLAAGVAIVVVILIVRGRRR
jgi:cobalamin biosynthesis Mg chelatase CobN